MQIRLSDGSCKVDVVFFSEENEGASRFSIILNYIPAFNIDFRMDMNHRGDYFGDASQHHKCVCELCSFNFKSM